MDGGWLGSSECLYFSFLEGKKVKQPWRQSFEHKEVSRVSFWKGEKPFSCSTRIPLSRCAEEGGGGVRSL